MQAETHPAQSCRGWLTFFKFKEAKTPHLLNLSHMMVNSEIRGTSLSCFFGSWLFLRYLKKRLAKDWSFPWAILRRKFLMCWVYRLARKVNRFQTEDQWVTLASCMHPSVLRCLANHIKLSFLFKYSASVSVANCMSAFSVRYHLTTYRSPVIKKAYTV